MLKRILSFALCLIMIMSFCGCSEKGQNPSTKDDSIANAYLETAQMFVSKGDYSSAIDTLEEGIKKTNSDKLSSYLKSVKEMQANDGGTKDPSGGSVVNPTVPSGSQTNRNSLPGVEEISEDLLMIGANNAWIAKEWRELNIESVEILRRSGDDTYDEVFVSVVYGDDYYCVKEEYSLDYCYYTDDGWYLEDYDTEKTEMTARRGLYTSAEFVANMKKHFTTCTVISQTSSTSKDGTYINTIEYTATFETRFYTINFSGEYMQEFADGLWDLSNYFDITHYDWSNIKGVYKYEYKTDIALMLIVEDVVQLNENNIKIQYSGTTVRYDSYYEDYDVKTMDTVSRNKRLSFGDVMICGKTFTIPKWIQGGLNLPWEDGSTLIIEASVEDGFYNQGLIYNSGRYYLEKYVPES